jgi:hypothetical protein
MNPVESARRANPGFNVGDCSTRDALQESIFANLRAAHDAGAVAICELLVVRLVQLPDGSTAADAIKIISQARARLMEGRK